MSKNTAKTDRVDTVFIRISSGQQDDAGQRANVAALLNEQGVHVPEDYWFVCVVPRANVQGNADFNRLMDLVKAGKVRNVYVETQDRWGTGDTAELFTLLGLLADHGTALWDLRDKVDLTGKDDATEIRVFLGSIKSKKERQDLAYRSMRTKVNSFKETGTWPTGTHPYGYGKRCYAADGRLLWEWQPVDRSHGQLYYPDAAGQLKPVGPGDARIPRKSKGQRERTVLIPSNNPDFVRAVRLIFDLYTRVGLSRRQICARLNAEGLTFNGRPFTHPHVSNLLVNPAYVGDTHYGKVRTGRHYTFDPQGLVVKVDKPRGEKREERERLVKTNTHESLIDRPTFVLAQKKLVAEQERISFAPRNPAYFLKQLFVCGHCGKGLTGRTETDRTTREKTVIYVCPTYIAGRCNGHPVSCGYQRITHSEAVQLLLDKIAELDLPFEEAVGEGTAGEGATANLQARLARLGHDSKETSRHWGRWVEDGVHAFAAYLVENFGVEYPVLPRMRKWAHYFYCSDEGYGDLSMQQVSDELTSLRAAIITAEEQAVDKAQRKLAQLREEHRQLTLAWARASKLQQEVLQREIVGLEAAIGEWEPRTTPLSKRLEGLYAAEAERELERKKLLAEWPTLENRQKGESMRRLFKTVTLFWERTFHPASKKPTRPRKTSRPGRYSYTLQRDRIQWAFAVSNLATFS